MVRLPIPRGLTPRRRWYAFSTNTLPRAPRARLRRELENTGPKRAAYEIMWRRICRLVTYARVRKAKLSGKSTPRIAHPAGGAATTRYVEASVANIPLAALCSGRSGRPIECARCRPTCLLVGNALRCGIRVLFCGDRLCISRKALPGFDSCVAYPRRCCHAIQERLIVP